MQNPIINKLFKKKTYEIDISLITQDFKPLCEYKEKYGEVNTPFSLIENMMDLFPDECFTDPCTRWLDPAGGYGYFTMILYNRLMVGLREKIKSPCNRSKHILDNMIYICELNESHIKGLREIFNSENIICNDFLSTSIDTWREIIQFSKIDTDNEYSQYKNKSIGHNKVIKTNNNNPFYTYDGFNEFNGFDYIIGNPPYNSNGFKKVPTNSKQEKKKDGKTIWVDFIKHSISLLKQNGLLCMITPSIWMKPDKAKMYNYMLQYKIHNLRCFTNTETNKIFKKQAQTPTCFYLLEKTQTQTHVIIPLYNIIDTDSKENQYKQTKNYPYYEYRVKIGSAIPLLGSSIIYKIQEFMEIHNIPPLIIYKTNMTGVNITLQDNKTETYKYPNIKTCILSKTSTSNNKIPTQIIQYSNNPCKYHGEKKLVLAHKMYGYPYLDEEGIYGISNRDNYIILACDYDNSISKLREIQQFLNTKLVRFIYETTRYRMKYLEKYAFEFIPDITKINMNMDMDMDKDNYETLIYNLLRLTKREIVFIKSFSSRL
jgi:site-specific DNA-methyltransferase (adenine-specific)